MVERKPPRSVVLLVVLGVVESVQYDLGKYYIYSPKLSATKAHNSVKASSQSSPIALIVICDP